jgi:hypothetical protein
LSAGVDNQLLIPDAALLLPRGCIIYPSDSSVGQHCDMGCVQIDGSLPYYKIRESNNVFNHSRIMNPVLSSSTKVSRFHNLQSSNRYVVVAGCPSFLTLRELANRERYEFSGLDVLKKKLPELNEIGMHGFKKIVQTHKVNVEAQSKRL